MCRACLWDCLKWSLQVTDGGALFCLPASLQCPSFFLGSRRKGGMQKKINSREERLAVAVGGLEWAIQYSLLESLESFCNCLWIFLSKKTNPASNVLWIPLFHYEDWVLHPNLDHGKIMSGSWALLKVGGTDKKGSNSDLTSKVVRYTSNKQHSQEKKLQGQ